MDNSPQRPTRRGSRWGQLSGWSCADILRSWRPSRVCWVRTWCGTPSDRASHSGQSPAPCGPNRPAWYRLEGRGDKGFIRYSYMASLICNRVGEHNYGNYSLITRRMTYQLCTRASTWLIFGLVLLSRSIGRRMSRWTRTGLGDKQNFRNLISTHFRHISGKSILCVWGDFV